MKRRDKIMDCMKGMTKVEQIALLESISKEIRQKNSIRINSRKFMDTRVDERPDEITLKA